MAILRFFLLIVCSCLIFFASGTYALEGKPEYKVKAVFLYNFLSFVDWPASAHLEKPQEMPVCILGEDPFGEYIDTLRGSRVGEKTVAVKRLKNLKDIKACSAVFIADSEDDNLEQILQYSRKHSVLTVSDMDDFVDRGGVIQFVIKDRKIRFKINVGAAKLSGLKISSKLIRVGYVEGEK